METVITIDGPAGSGKSTISSLLAKKIGYLYLDTGAMYRAVALAAKRKKIHLNDGKALGELCNSLDLHFITDQDPPRLFLNEEDISAAIRSPEMDMASSKVSAVSEVRKAMTGLQRKIAKGMTLVAEGRDMGTVVFPDAKHKFYLTASLEIRTERRYKERLGRGETVHMAVVESELKERDHQDETRPIAPLRPAEDAKIIDTTEMTPEQVIGTILCQLDLG
ncbi:MAG: cytidylate kinase [Desulfobacteraceae bacterium 4484_190.2]|nr:MAG: cytidylate kinase [Desulfobacteraceae bacterium 4484_190.2]